MLKAVLFDLDGTLLDLDGDAFLEDYIDKLADFLHPWVNKDDFRAALWSAAVGALASEHPGRTNQEVLTESLSETLAIDAGTLRRRIEKFNATQAPQVLPGGHPRPGARRAVQAARAMGLKIAVATTPIYGLPVVMERLARAGVADIPWDVIATDRFSSTKPYPAYYLELSALLGVDPVECLMVGDDAFNDLAAGAVGMATYYVGPPMGGLNVGAGGPLEDVIGIYQQQTRAGLKQKVEGISE